MYGLKQKTVDTATAALFLGAPIAYGLARHAVMDVLERNAPRLPLVGKSIERRFARDYLPK
tara:strand:- start:138 stop:320 length:183 start_codon:yes stop_codon:yes gene_type:complete